MCFSTQHGDRMLFALQDIRRIFVGGLDRMIHNGQEGNGYGQEYGQDPGIYRQAGPVGEILHPASDKPERQGQGNHYGNKYEDHELQGEAPDQGSPGCAHHLPDPDLLGPQLRIVRRNAKETQAGDQNGEQGEALEQLAHLYF